MTSETKEAPELKKPEKKVSLWTTEEASNIKTVYGCELLVENGSLQEVSIADVPTDAFIVTYSVFESGSLGPSKYDLTRGTKTKIFDMYYDKFKHGLKDIQYGKGTISPKLWGHRTKQASKKKRRKG
ncbi:MAG: hypothetical protein CMO72_07465 [Verrucomicrobiales bacterium]|nr:hypothetical protein [Verrucomicrobiales bacterium]|tara:strand:- start:75 stop:455 length:381 start_codon:yes stop_codon:yes gene_type:complete